jgi:LytR cell envelope-related transcriptional attenuator
MYLASVAKDIDKTQVINLVLDDAPGGFLAQTKGIDGAFLLTPKTGNFTAVNGAIADVFTSTSTADRVLVNTPVVTTNPLFAKARVEVQNGTWQVGLAARMKKNLQEKGFSVSAVGNSAVRPISSTVIYVHNSQTSPEVVSALEHELNTTVKPWPTDLSNNPTFSKLRYQPDSDLLIIIGTDYFNQ